MSVKTKKASAVVAADAQVENTFDTNIISENEGEDNICKKYAISYLKELGFSLVPAKTRTKKGTCIRSWSKYQDEKPTLKDIKNWFWKYPKAGIGIITGKISGIVVLDIDPPEGLESIKDKEIPDTVTIETGGGGVHYYFKYPEELEEVRNFQNKDDIPGVDFRGDGGLIYAPPSVHPSGNRYKFKEGKNPEEIEFAEVPHWLLDRLKGDDKEKEVNNSKAKNKSRNKKGNIFNNDFDATNIFRKVKSEVGIEEVLAEFYEPITDKMISCINPEHQDKNPSCSIDYDKDLFNCFSCGVGGSIIDLVMLLTDCNELEAAIKIAERFDIDIPEDCSQLKTNYELRRANKKVYKKALEYFQENLTENHIKWLKSRYGLTEETIKRAKIGFNPGGLLNHLRDEFDESILEQSGLFKRNSNSLYDFLDNRIMIPYLNNINETVYFTARAIDESEAKYLNLDNISSPLFEARAKGHKALVITEGAFDALAGRQLLEKKGWDAADFVALSTCDLNKKQEKRLIDLVKKYLRIIIITDNDQSGKEGAYSIAEKILTKTRKVVKIGRLEGQEGTDIADYCIAQRDLTEVLNKEIDFIELKILELEELERKEEVEERLDKSIYPDLIKLQEKSQKYYVEKICEVLEEVDGLSPTPRDIFAELQKNEREINYANFQEEFQETFDIPFQGKNATTLAKYVISYLAKDNEFWEYVASQESYYHYRAEVGVWERDNELYLRSQIREIIVKINELISAYKLEKEIKTIRESRSQIKEIIHAMNETITGKRKNKELFNPGIDPNLEFINLKNGMLNWKTGEILEHDPSYYSIFQLPIEYDEEADCPNWKEALKDWLPEKKARDFVQEFAGYCLIPDTSFEKAVILHGKGRNGKSTFLNTLGAMYGSDNRASKSLHKLNERFGSVTIKDKLVNFAPDIDPEYLESTGNIKALIAGEEINGEYKHKANFDFIPIVRMIFSCNELPKTRDKSEGWLRRIEIVNFPNQFKVNGDSNLGERLLNELPGVFNWALEGLRRLKKNGEFAISDSMKKAKGRYRKFNDSVVSFIEDRTTKITDASIPTAYLYREYNKYCDEFNLKPVTRNQFTRSIKDEGYKGINTNFEVCSEHGNFRCDEDYCSEELENKSRRGIVGLVMKNEVDDYWDVE